MSFSHEVIRLLARFVKNTGVSGAVLTYGVQGVQGRYADLVRCFEQENFAYTPLAPDEIRLDPQTEYGESVHQEVLFRMLGFSTVESLDYYPDEQPTHLIDLCQPLPADFTRQYDLVLDGGTMEHCFNIKEVLFNSVRLVKPDGYIMHLNPASGMLNHGFYQISPTLYFDFYSENGFDDFDLKLLLEGRYYQFNPDYVFNDFLGEPAHALFTARKRQEVDPLRMPIQNVYRQKFGEGQAQASQAPSGSVLADLKARIPSRRLLHWLLALRKRQMMARLAHRLKV